MRRFGEPQRAAAPPRTTKSPRDGSARRDERHPAPLLARRRSASAWPEPVRPLLGLRLRLRWPLLPVPAGPPPERLALQSRSGPVARRASPRHPTGAPAARRCPVADLHGRPQCRRRVRCHARKQPPTCKRPISFREQRHGSPVERCGPCRHPRLPLARKAAEPGCRTAANQKELTGEAWVRHNGIARRGITTASRLPVRAAPACGRCASLNSCR